MGNPWCVIPLWSLIRGGCWHLVVSFLLLCRCMWPIAGLLLCGCAVVAPWLLYSPPVNAPLCCCSVFKSLLRTCSVTFLRCVWLCFEVVRRLLSNNPDIAVCLLFGCCKIASGYPQVVLRLRSGCCESAFRLSSGCSQRAPQLLSGCSKVAVGVFEALCFATTLRLLAGCFKLCSSCFNVGGCSDIVLRSLSSGAKAVLRLP